MRKYWFHFEVTPSASVPSGPRRCIDVTVPAVPFVSSASRSRIRCRSCSRQLASKASKNPVLPARGCVPCPNGLLLPLHGNAGEGCCADLTEQLTRAAIPVPATRGTVGAVLRLPGITVPTGAITPWPLVFPARCPPNGAGHSRPASTS